MPIESSVSQWGNSLAIRLPKVIANDIGLEFGTDINIETTNDQCIIIRPKSNRDRLIKALANATEENIQLLDSDDLIGCESWEYTNQI